ncbi:MAG: hypothetical protein K2N48_08875 [Muribaculaceae bacterium]|nr:hypothetical protein [Muribaculaceae bacterium]
MKKILLPLMLFPFLSEAQTYTPTDTLLNISNPDKVVITESSKGTRVSLEDGQESILIAYPDGANVKTYRHTSKSIFNLPGLPCGRRTESCGCHGNGWDFSMDGVCIGLVDAMGQTAGGGLQWSKSFEINWLSCLNVGYEFSRSRIYLGLGFAWRNYKATADARWLQPDGDGGVEWGSAPEGVNVRATQLKVFSLQLPLMYTWRIPKSYLKWRMGPILNFNTYSSIKGIYDDSAGNRCEYFTKEFDRRPFTVDLFASLSYQSAIGIYVRYSPMKVLGDASPINFTPFSVGLTIGL